MGVIIRQSIKGTIVNYIGSFIGFITTFFIITRYLTTEEIGLTRVLLEVSGLFAGIAQLGTNSSIMRFFPYFKDPEKKDHGIFFWSLIVPLAGFLFFLILYLCLQGPIITFFSEKSPLFLDYSYYVIPLSFFLLYISVFETNSNVLYRIVVPKLIREVIIRLMLIVVYLLYAFRVLNLDGFIIAFCLTYGIALCINIFYLFSLQRVSLKPDMEHITKPIRRDFLFYTLFLITAALGGAITPSINTIFVSARMGLSFTGVFAVATFIAAIIEIPYRSLGAISQPHISQAIKDNDIKTANDLCKSVALHQLLVGSFIFFFIWINIDLIFTILPNGQEYAAGKWVVFIVGLSRLFNSAFSVGTSVLGYSKYYYFSLIFTFLLTGTAILLNIAWIPIWGLNGAALATLVSYVIYYFFLLGLVRWKIKTSPFSFKQIVVVLIILALFALNLIWEAYLSPLFLALPMKPLWSSILDGVISSVLFGAAGGLAVYYFKVSEQINSLVRKYWKKSIDWIHLKR